MSNFKEQAFYIGGYFYDIGQPHRLLVAEAKERGRGVFVFDFTQQDLESKPYFGCIGFRTINTFRENFDTPASIEQSNTIMDSLEQYDISCSYAVMFRKFKKLLGGGIISFDDNGKLEAMIDDLADYFKQQKES